MLPHATPTTNSLNHHHLFVLPVLLILYHFPIQPTQSFTTSFYINKKLHVFYGFRLEESVDWALL